MHPFTISVKATEIRINVGNAEKAASFIDLTQNILLKGGVVVLGKE